MEIYEYEVGINRYRFEVKSAKTGTGFKRVCKMFRNDDEVIKRTAHYQNRTWESFEGQDVMYACVSDAIESARDAVVRYYKEVNGIKHLAGAKKRLLMERFAEIPSVKELAELKFIIQEGR